MARHIIGAGHEAYARLGETAAASPQTTPAAAAVPEGSADMAAWEDLSFHVAQAQGMVSVQADCSMTDALTLMHERAQVQHQSLTQIASAVLERRIRFGF